MLIHMRKHIAIGFMLISAVILAVVTGMTYKSSNDSRKLLEESIKSQLISIASAAREYIDPDDFVRYGNLSEAMASADYNSTLTRLRTLANSVEAKYIYVLKKVSGKVSFIYDTDTADNSSFEEYKINSVHEKAFSGQPSAGITSIKDEHGNSNTGAVPIIKNGVVIGVVGVQLEDKYIIQNINQSRINFILLTTAMVFLLFIVGFVIAKLFEEIAKAQNKLERMAHYDLLTNLPNRQYLLEYLDKETAKGSRFAMYFVDLDNFKKVNDNAGHDAGDALLRHISNYLQTAHTNSRLFRPASGKLNVAARIGGDEFILIAPDVNNEKDACDFAKELLDGFNVAEIDKNIKTYDIGLSIGIALFPSSSEDYNVLIKYADIAMYHAKKSGKNCFMLYNQEMKPKDEK